MGTYENPKDALSGVGTPIANNGASLSLPLRGMVADYSGQHPANQVAP
jgi:hypothetical protein